jgi:hypothetical protein
MRARACTHTLLEGFNGVGFREQVVGEISIKKVYEIAKIKQQDMPHIQLQQVKPGPQHRTVTNP